MKPRKWQPKPEPTPDEIERTCKAYQASWSEHERSKRASFRDLPKPVETDIVDTSALRSARGKWEG